MFSNFGIFKTKTNVSFARRVSFALISMCLLTLTATTTMFFIVDVRTSQSTFINEHQEIADAFSTTLAAAAVFEDEIAAKDVLKALHRTDSIISAEIRGLSGEVWIHHGVLNKKEGSEITVKSSITHQQNQVGILSLQVSMARVNNLIMKKAQYSFLVLCIGFILSSIIAFALSRDIVDPLSRLEDAISNVTLHQDFNTKVESHSTTETQRLATSFNKMTAGLKQRDIRLNKLIQDLRKAEESASQASRAKSSFLANMSHEIRTPLNGVIGMAQMLSNSSLNDEQQGQVSTIVDSGRILLSVVNDILDYSKIEAGKLGITPVEADLKEVVQSIISLWAATAKDKGITLSVDYPEIMPDRLLFDSVRVTQCISNLVSNAIKFTDVGGVFVQVLCSKSSYTDDFNLAVAITDTGIVIPDEKLPHLFKEFCQADESSTRRFGGTGLGLSISKQLAEMMGGDVEAHSLVGEGSTFIFKFTAKTSDSAREPSSASSSHKSDYKSTALSKLTILLVDDNVVNRSVIKAFLKNEVAEILEAEHGLDALRYLESHSIDVVLLDIQMPVMDGREAIKEIRTSEQHWKNIPVIAITADVMENAAEKYMKLGMNSYIAKPFDQADLKTKILAVISTH